MKIDLTLGELYYLQDLIIESQKWEDENEHADAILDKIGEVVK